MYAYDKGELNARVEETETTENWTREKVSFDAAYGHERVLAQLFLPRHGTPPFQAVVFFPGAMPSWTTNSIWRPLNPQNPWTSC